MKVDLEDLENIDKETVPVSGGHCCCCCTI